MFQNMTRRRNLKKEEPIIKKQLSEESAEKKQERLAKMRASYNKRCSEETAEKKARKACKKGERIIKNKLLSNQ